MTTDLYPVPERVLAFTHELTGSAGYQGIIRLREALWKLNESLRAFEGDPLMLFAAFARVLGIEAQYYPFTLHTVVMRAQEDDQGNVLLRGDDEREAQGFFDILANMKTSSVMARVQIAVAPRYIQYEGKTYSIRPDYHALEIPQYDPPTSRVAPSERASFERGTTIKTTRLEIQTLGALFHVPFVEGAFRTDLVPMSLQRAAYDLRNRINNGEGYAQA